MSTAFPEHSCVGRWLVAVAVLAACADRGAASVDGTTTSTTDPSGTTGPSSTTLASSGPEASSSSGTGSDDLWCFQQEQAPAPAQRILLVVDTSASMLVPNRKGVVPWDELRSSVSSLVACLSDDPRIRAEYGLRLMPGPVGADVCGRSSALDIEGWVSGPTLVAGLDAVTPQGGRSMRRSLEALPRDADLVVVLSHGAPGCGDDLDPEALDEAVADAVVSQGVAVTFAEVALDPGPTPDAVDGEPDGVDPHQALRAIGLQTETRCRYLLPSFDASSACINLTECFVGSAIPPCVAEIIGPQYELDPNAAERGDLDEVLVWVGDEPIPRSEGCGAEPSWRILEAPEEGSYSTWRIEYCTASLCERRWSEGSMIQHSCNLDAPG